MSTNYLFSKQYADIPNFSRSSAVFVSYHKTGSGSTLVAECSYYAQTIWDVYTRLRKMPGYSDLCIMPIHHHRSNSADTHYGAVFYFEEDPVIVAMIRRRDTARSTTRVSYLVELTNRNSVHTVCPRKISRFIASNAVRISQRAVDTYILMEGLAAFRSDIRPVIRRADSKIGMIDTAKVLDLYEHLLDIGVEVPNPTLRTELETARIARQNNIARVTQHDTSIAISKVSTPDGDRYLLAGVQNIIGAQNVYDPAKLHTPVEVSADEIPFELQLRVSTLSMCDNNTFVEGTGYKYNDDTYYVTREALV